MNSSPERPFAFFELFFHKNIYRALNKFYSVYIEHEVVLDIDKQNHIITIGTGTGPEDYSFEHHIKKKINTQIEISKQFIDQQIQVVYHDKDKVRGYCEFLRNKLNQLSQNKSFGEFTFIPDIIDTFHKYVNQFSVQRVNLSDSAIYSFNIVADSLEQQLLKAEKLFDLLTEQPALIQGSNEDFIKAFTGQEIDHPIRWQVRSKNRRYTSKSSLFYFLEQLMLNRHISRNYFSFQNRYIRYVFRDHEGNEFKNLSTSSAQRTSENPMQKNRINEIVTTLGSLTFS